MIADLPFGRSYWVDPARLLAGEYPGSRNPLHARARLASLVRLGIRLFVDLTVEDEVGHGGRYDLLLEDVASEAGVNVRHLRYGMEDMSVPTVEEMVGILDTIDASIAGGRPVYVHCFMGIGRTGTVVGCWLVRHGRAVTGNVLDAIASLRASDPSSYIRSPVTDAQCALVSTWGYGR
jgi:hypothetical protein